MDGILVLQVFCSFVTVSVFSGLLVFTCAQSDRKRKRGANLALDRDSVRPAAVSGGVVSNGAVSREAVAPKSPALKTPIPDYSIPIHNEQLDFETLLQRDSTHHQGKSTKSNVRPISSRRIPSDKPDSGREKRKQSSRDSGHEKRRQSSREGRKTPRGGSTREGGVKSYRKGSDKSLKEDSTQGSSRASIKSYKKSSDGRKSSSKDGRKSSSKDGRKSLSSSGKSYKKTSSTRQSVDNTQEESNRGASSRENLKGMDSGSKSKLAKLTESPSSRSKKQCVEKDMRKKLKKRLNDKSLYTAESSVRTERTSSDETGSKDKSKHASLLKSSRSSVSRVTSSPKNAKKRANDEATDSEKKKKSPHKSSRDEVSGSAKKKKSPHKRSRNETSGRDRNKNSSASKKTTKSKQSVIEKLSQSPKTKAKQESERQKSTRKSHRL